MARFKHVYLTGRVRKFDYFTSRLWSVNSKRVWKSYSDSISFNQGTVCDAGVFAPVLSFQKLFEAEGVPITDAETRAPMGVHKRVCKSLTLLK